MTEKARKNLERCKMDCFNCPFPDCVLPYRIPDKVREEYEKDNDKELSEK